MACNFSFVPNYQILLANSPFFPFMVKPRCWSTTCKQVIYICLIPRKMTFVDAVYGKNPYVIINHFSDTAKCPKQGYREKQVYCETDWLFRNTRICWKIQATIFTFLKSTKKTSCILKSFSKKLKFFVWFLSIVVYLSKSELTADKQVSLNADEARESPF